MHKQPYRGITMGRGSNIAFTMVVLASYFAMFSAAPKDISLVRLGLMIGLGIAYVAIGTYGYGFCGRTHWMPLRMAYFAIQILLGGLIVYLGEGAGFNALILMPLAGHAIVLLSPGWGMIANASVIVTYIVAVGLFTNNLSAIWSGLPAFLAGVVFITVFTQMAVDEEKARTEVERLVEELEGANQRLRGYAVQAEELAITKERNRVAREIHDGLGHYLTVIHMQIQAARVVMKPGEPKVQEALLTAQNMAQEALVDVRKSVASLRASPNEGQPLPEVIARLATDCEAGGLQTRVAICGEPQNISPQTQLTLYRAAQEGLNNVRKHSEANRVDLVLDYSETGKIKLTIRDDGKGTDHFDGGFGLIGLRERSNLLGGETRTLSEIGKGFTLEVVLPI